MNKLALALLSTAALAFGSSANATITIVNQSSNTLTSSSTVFNVDNPLNQLAFGTNATVASTVTSFFDFKESFASTAFFTATNASGSVTLEQLLSDGTFSTVAAQSIGSGPFLGLQTGLLAANTVYRFTYTSTFPSGGNTNGNGIFTAVPEPATWGLMLIGFGGMGVAMRRSRKRIIAQIA